MQKTLNRNVPVDERKGWSSRETAFIIWAVAALVSVVPVAAHLEASVPIFTVVWLVVPLIAVLRARDAARAGFRAVPRRELLAVASANLVLLLLVMAVLEPWSDAYGTLVREAVAADVTFAWLDRYDGPAGWLMMFIYSGTVTIFAEELFFRGWLLHWLRQRLGRWPAIFAQAALFALPQAIPALFLTPVQAVVWVGAYAFLGVGVINGWAAARTGSIWPGAIAAPLMNLIVTALALS